VIVLSGEADLTCAGQLRRADYRAAVQGNTAAGTIDVSELWFADSASIRTLVLAARTLRERGWKPGPAAARGSLWPGVLALTGAEQMFTIRGETHSEPEAGESEGMVTRCPEPAIDMLRHFEASCWFDPVRMKPQLSAGACDTLRAAFDNCMVTIGPGQEQMRG